MAQSVKCPTLDFTQVMILQFMGSSHTSGSMLTAWSLLGILSVSLSLCLSLSLSLSLFLPLPSLNLLIKKQNILCSQPSEFIEIFLKSFPLSLAISWSVGSKAALNELAVGRLWERSWQEL